MKTAAIYSRKSKTSEVGDSIKNQISLCKEYGMKRGYENFIIYEDDGFSGKNSNRPSYTQLMNDAKNNKFNAIICYRLDRISRSIKDFSSLIDFLQPLSIDFISITEQFDTSSPIGRAMMYIASIFSQLERETISERIKDNMLELSKTGQWLGGQLPFGFESKEIVFTYDSNPRKFSILEPINSEIETVKLIYEKYLDFKSLNKTSRYLNTLNIKSKKGCKWDKNKVHLILTNPLYVKASKDIIEYLASNHIKVIGTPNNENGILIYNKTKSIRTSRNKDSWIASISYHSGCIDSLTWIKVQDIIEQNKKAPPREGSSNTALLGGIIYCGLCNKKMIIKHGHFEANSNNRIIYYICSSKQKDKSCSCNNIKATEIDTLIFETLFSNLYDFDLFSNHYGANSKEESSINSIIKTKESQIYNLLNVLSLSDIVKDEILNQISVLKSEIISLKETFEPHSTPKEQSLFNPNNINIDLLNKMLTEEEKKTLISLCIKKLIWNTNLNTLSIELK